MSVFGKPGFPLFLFYHVFTLRPIVKSKIYFRLLAMLVVYLLLKFFGGSFGALALYPITLLVTFLHEFGHALGALLTGGAVDGMQINPDGSGYTVTRGGWQAIILMGGYLGSAVLGNILLFIGARKRAMTQSTLLTLAALMALAGIIWFESFGSTAILFGFAAVLFLLSQYTNWDQDMLMFFGVAGVLYIIQDFSVGPKSDLAMYEQVVGIFSAQVWMYIWLGITLLLSYSNIRAIFNRT